MESLSVEAITSAVAPVVMVSASGLLFMGIQTKNLHLADRIRVLTQELRALGASADQVRRDAVRDQLVVFRRRIWLSQRALELLYVAIVCFVVTSLLLASAPWLGARPVALIVAVLFLGGVAALLLALVVEFVEMRAGLRTIDAEIAATLRASGRG